LFQVPGNLFNQVFFFRSHERASQYLANSVLSTRTPGLIVEETVTLEIYRPLTPAGRALPTASSTAAAFSEICSAGNERRPMATPILAVLSSLNSTRPAFTSLIA